MTNQPLTTYQKTFTTKKEQKVDEKKVSMQAERIVNSVAFPMVLKAALELGIIDILAEEGEGTWLSPSEIAVRLPTKPTNLEAPVLLDRMLLFLVSHSFLKCRTVEIRENGRTGDIERVYAAEPVCKYFVKDSDGSGSLLSSFLLLQSQVLFKTWTNLKDVILEGKDGFSSAHGLRTFDGVNHEYGDMFIKVPKGDAIFMKWILHDWDDEDCIKILRNCWKSLPNIGKVIIVDMITPQEPKDDYASIVFGIDLLMLSQYGGKERSLSQLENLALDSGFVRCKIVCPIYSYSIIELHK